MTQKIKVFKENFSKYIELNENENTTSQNFGDASKVVLREKFITLNAYIRKEESSQIKSLSQETRKRRAIWNQSKHKEENNKDKRTMLIKLKTQKQ